MQTESELQQNRSQDKTQRDAGLRWCSVHGQLQLHPQHDMVARRNGPDLSLSSGCGPGMQYIHNATDLASIPDGSYGFLLASHILEHVANPLRATEEFHRVLKPKGFMLIAVPDRLHTFDHRRTVAPRPRSTRTEWQAAAGEPDAERAATLWNYGGIERTLRGKRGLGMMAAACTEEADCYAPWGAKCYLPGLG